MAKKKQFVTAAAAFAVAASAVAPAITADAASSTVRLSSDYVRGGDLNAALDKEYKGSEIYWYKSSVDMNKLGVFQTAKGFVKGQGIRVEKRVRVLNYAQEIKPESEFVFEQGVPVSGIRVQPVLFADGNEYAKPLSVAGFNTDKVGEFEGTLTYANKAYGTVTKTVKYTVVKSAPVVESVKAINSTQAVVEFDKEIGEVAASNFEIDNSTSVIKAEVNESNKKQVTLTFNKELLNLTSYNLTVNGVKSVTGAEMEEAETVGFKYEIGAVKSIQLTSTKFYNGDNILDKVVVKDENGLVLDKSSLTIEVASTDTAVDAAGDVTTTAKKSFYVEVKVKNGANEVLATTGAVKVDVSPSLEIAGLEGIHIGSLTTGSEVSQYEAAKRADTVDTNLKVNEDGAVLNLFAKDIDGNIILVTPDTTEKITNLNPTVANVKVDTGKFVIDTVSAGKASAKIEIGDVVYTVSFDVLANEKISDAQLGATSVKLDSSSNDLVTTKNVSLTLKDQYGDTIAYPLNTNGTNDTASEVTYDDGSKLRVTSSNTRVAEASVAADGTITIDRPASNHLKGSSTVTVVYKAANGTVLFTKTIAVTSTDFENAVASYDLVLVSENTLLDADNDTNETGTDIDDSVSFVLNKLDKNGNVIGKEDFAAGSVELVASASNSSDNAFLDTITYSDVDSVAGTEVGTVTLTADAVLKLINSGTVKVTAKVGGVNVDTLSVNYKNTDSVAKMASVNTTNKLVDLSQLGGTSVTLTELLFGKLNLAGTKYISEPAVKIVDQFGKTMNYDIATSTSALLNGVTVNTSTAVVTNLNNVNNTSGTLSLVDDTKAGSLTVVIPSVTTTENGDLLAAPVSFNVTLVK